MAKRKFMSKAFRRGFSEGFAAPMLAFSSQRYPRARDIDDSVEGAWRRVGKALQKSYEGEGRRIGKATGKERERLPAE